MKTLNKFLSILLLFGAMIFSPNAWAVDVTFNATSDYPDGSALSYTKSGITIQVGAGTLTNQSEYRCNSGSNLIVTSSVGNITKIVVTCTATGNNNYGPKKINGTPTNGGGSYVGGTGSTGTWTGNSASVSLHADAQVRMTRIVVTYTSSNCDYMVYNGSEYIVWDTKPQSDPVPVGPTISGYDPLIIGSELFVWCEIPITSSPCVSSGYINNTTGTYKDKYRFAVVSPSESKHYPSGASALYAVYAKDGCQVTTAPYVECNSPFGTLSAAGGTTVTWSGSNITKTISVSGQKGSGAKTWEVVNQPSTVATINSSGVLTIKGTGGYASATITVRCTIAASGNYCEESKTIDITVNAQTYTVTYHLTGVTKTSGPTTVSCVEDDLSVYFTVNDGYTSEGIVGKVCFVDGGEWCYNTANGDTNIEFGTSTRLDYVNDGNFDRNIDVYITAQEDICTNPWMAFDNGTNRTVSYGAAGWTDAASVKVSAGGAKTGQAITYATTNSSVASVNASTGAVTVGSAGTATISATAAKANGYCEKSVSYTVTVNCVAPTLSATESGKEMGNGYVNPTSASINGCVIKSYGGGTVTAHGYVVSTTANPTLTTPGVTTLTWNQSRAIDKAWGNQYLSSLTPGTTYYARGYATNDCGLTGYSTQISFTTPRQYYITYDANGGEGSIANQVKLEGENATLSDGSGFSRDGYTILRWNTADNGSGTNYALGATYTGNADLNLYAIWQAGNYTVTLNNQSATTAGTTSVAVTFNASTNLTSAIAKPTKTGYTFGGYFTATGGGGSQLIGTDGNWIASVDGYTDAEKKWQYAGNLVLYAKWTANEIELELSANGGESDGSATVLYDATSLKAGTLTHATYEGHTLVGYYNNESHTLKVLSSDGSFATSSVSGYITDGKWSRTTSPTTLYAWWATEIRSVTFDLQGKGDNFVREVEYNTKVSQPANPTHVDYNFVGWMTTEGGSTQFNFNSNITTNTTVYAKWTPKTYEHLIFACVDLSLDTEDGDPVLVTSRSGVNIMATKKLKVSVSGALNGHRVTLSGTDLKFYKKVTEPVTRFVELTGANSLVAPLTDAEVYVSYNPTSPGTGAILQPDITVACDGFEETFSAKVKARNLPESVAIVARVGDTWHALPANLATEQTPAPIMVDVTTAAGLLTAKGPSTVQYKLWPVATVNSANDRFGTATGYTPEALYGDRLRFAGNDNKALWANNSSANNGIRNFAAITAVGTTMDNISAYEWKITTTEVDGQFVYTLQTLQSANVNNLRLWGNKWGTYGSYGIAELYILPLTVVQTADISIMEWGTNEVAVKYANAGNVASGTFKAKIGTGAQTNVTCTSLGGDIYKLTGVGNLQGSPAKTLLLNMTESSTPKQAMFAIPLIITDSKNDTQASSLAAGGNGSTLVTEGRQIARNLDVIVRNGGTLSTSTATGSFKDLYIYPGGKADLSQNIGFSNIYLRGGLSWLDAVRSFRLPQLMTEDDITISGLQNKGNGVYYDLYADDQMFYMIALPKSVALIDVTNEEGTDDFDAVVKYYDGSRRVANPSAPQSWIAMTNPTQQIERGKGYEIMISPRSSGAMSGRTIGILRFPLLSETAWSNVTAMSPEVRAYGMAGYNANPRTVNANDVGWNLLGNPFYVGVRKSEASMDNGAFAVEHLEQELNPVTGGWTGHYEWAMTKTKYFTIPNKLDYDYTDCRAADYTLEPFYPFFIQAKSNGNFRFDEGVTLQFAARRRFAPTDILPKELRVDFELINESDKTDIAGLNIADEYSALFDLEDKEKTIDLSAARLKLYTVMDGYRIAFNSLPSSAINEIPLGYLTTDAGEFVVALSEKSHLNYFEKIILIDNELQLEWDLLQDAYTFSTDAMPKGNDTRFTLSLKIKQQTDIGTGLPNTGAGLDRLSATGYDGTIVLHGVPENAEVYVFDMNGKLLERVTSGTDSRLQLTNLPTGVYNVRVVVGHEAQTLRTIVR